MARCAVETSYIQNIKYVSWTKIHAITESRKQIDIGQANIMKGTVPLSYTAMSFRYTTYTLVRYGVFLHSLTEEKGGI